jgi:transcription-repair coupling factor (superfamily II helicase)
MTLQHLPQRVDRLPGFDSLLSAFDTKKGSQPGHGQVVGLSGPAKSLFLARVFQRREAQTVIVTYQSEQAQRMWDDLRNFGIPEDRLFLMPASESRWLSSDVTDYRALGERIGALAALASGEPCVVIGTAEAVFQRTAPPEDLTDHIITLRVGDRIALDHLLPHFTEIGYEAETTVARQGQYSKRGGILDIYPSTQESPVRIELFGDEIESIRAFDVATQRSTGKKDSVRILPMREVRLTTERVNNAVAKLRAQLQTRKMELAKAHNRAAFDLLNDRIEDDITRIQNGAYFDGLEEYLSFLVPEEICALDYLGMRDEGRGMRTGDTSSLIPHPSSLVVVDEPGQVKAHWERLAKELGESRERRFERGEILQGADHSSTCSNGMERAAREFPTLVLSQLHRKYEGFPVGKELNVSSAPMDSYRHRINFFADDVATWMANGADCLIVSDQPQRVREICAELKLPVGDGPKGATTPPDSREAPPLLGAGGAAVSIRPRSTARNQASLLRPVAVWR